MHMHAVCIHTCRVLVVYQPSRFSDLIFIPKTNTDGRDGIIGFDRDGYGPDDSNSRKTKVRTVSLAKLFRDFSVPSVIDYLSLDIEGAEAYVFSTFPWDEYTFLTLTVERPAKVLRESLKKHGYTYLCKYGWVGGLIYLMEM